MSLEWCFARSIPHQEADEEERVEAETRAAAARQVCQRWHGDLCRHATSHVPMQEAALHGPTITVHCHGVDDAC